MSNNVTRPTDENVIEFIDQLDSDRRKNEASQLLSLFKEWTKMKPVLWKNGLAGKGNSGIIGFGHYHYQYKSGREGDWFLTGFSPRKANITIYIMPGFERFSKELEMIGPYKNSVSCLYLSNLAKNNLQPLEKMVLQSIKIMKERYEWQQS